MKLDIVITGVGGQGIVLASRVLAAAAMHQGFEVRTSETIGMAQREGSVVSHVRIGTNLYGALVPDHSADILLSFELAETARGLVKLKPGGLLLANTGKVVPVSVPLGLSTYEEDKIKASLAQKTKRVYLLDATDTAVKAGSPKTINVVLLGALAAVAQLPFSSDELLKIVLASVPQKALEVNRQAFDLGRRLAEERQDGITTGTPSL